VLFLLQSSITVCQLSAELPLLLAWQTARQDIYVEWQRGADLANLSTKDSPSTSRSRRTLFVTDPLIGPVISEPVEMLVFGKI
jgi:hypothetical protein